MGLQPPPFPGSSDSTQSTPDSPGTTSDHPPLAWRPPPPPLHSSSRRRGSAQGTGRRGHLTRQRRPQAATLRALHGEAPVFTARCVYTHFGNGSKPAGRPKNAAEHRELSRKPARKRRSMRGAFGEVGQGKQPPRGLRREAFGTAKGSVETDAGVLGRTQGAQCWARRPRRGEPEFTCTASAQLRRRRDAPRPCLVP